MLENETRSIFLSSFRPRQPLSRRNYFQPASGTLGGMKFE